MDFLELKEKFTELQKIENEKNKILTYEDFLNLFNKFRIQEVKDNKEFKILKEIYNNFRYEFLNKDFNLDNFLLIQATLLSEELAKNLRNFTTLVQRNSKYYTNIFDD